MLNKQSPILAGASRHPVCHLHTNELQTHYTTHTPAPSACCPAHELNDTIANVTASRYSCIASSQPQTFGSLAVYIQNDAGTCQRMHHSLTDCMKTCNDRGCSWKSWRDQTVYGCSSSAGKAWLYLPAKWHCLPVSAPLFTNAVFTVTTHTGRQGLALPILYLRP